MVEVAMVKESRAVGEMEKKSQEHRSRTNFSLHAEGTAKKKKRKREQGEVELVESVGFCEARK